MTPYFQRDGITIYHADCRDVLPDIRADVMVTDPPYGMGFVTGGRSGWTSRWTGHRIQGDETTVLRDEVLAWWGDKPALVFGTWKTPAPAGVREVLVWDKVVSTGMGALDIPWRPSWEAIYVLGKGFTGQRGHGVLRFPLPTLAEDRKWHPTPKPVELMMHLISRCPAGVIIDPFMGCGPIAEACRNLGRSYIGMDTQEAYCERAAKRLQQAVLPLLVAD